MCCCWCVCRKQYRGGFTTVQPPPPLEDYSTAERPLLSPPQLQYSGILYSKLPSNHMWHSKQPLTGKPYPCLKQLLWLQCLLLHQRRAEYSKQSTNHCDTANIKKYKKKHPCLKCSPQELHVILLNIQYRPNDPATNSIMVQIQHNIQQLIAAARVNANGSSISPYSPEDISALVHRANDERHFSRCPSDFSPSTLKFQAGENHLKNLWGRTYCHSNWSFSVKARQV